jgi:hypothetical protein
VDELDWAVVLGEVAQALAQLGVAGAGLGEGEFGGGGLQVVVEEAGVVAVTGGVDADADAPRLRGRWCLR